MTRETAPAGLARAGTLPYVISQANANTSTDGSEIEFDSSVFSSPQAITLGGTQLELSEHDRRGDNHRPSGGRDRQRRRTVRVFQVDNGVTASLCGLTITGVRSRGMAAVCIAMGVRSR